MKSELLQNTINISSKMKNNALRVSEKDADWLVNSYIAHRGIHGDNIAENSQTSFSIAKQLGYPIELDLQLLDDGKTVVVFHDLQLNRLTKETGKTVYLSKEKLKETHLITENGEFSQDSILTLEEALSIVNGEVPLLIEFKNPKVFDRTLEARAMEILKYYKGSPDKFKYAIQSFNPLVVHWFKVNNPSIARGQLSGYLTDQQISLFKKLCSRHVPLKSITRPDFIAYEIDYIKKSPTIKTIEKKAEEKPNEKRPAIIGWTAKNQTSLENISSYADSGIFEGFLPKKQNKATAIEL